MSWRMSLRWAKPTAVSNIDKMILSNPAFFAIFLSTIVTILIIFAAIRAQSLILIMLGIAILIGFDLRSAFIIFESEFILISSFGYILSSQPETAFVQSILYILIAKISIFVSMLFILKRYANTPIAYKQISAGNGLWSASWILYAASTAAYLIFISIIFGNPVEAFSALQRRAILYGSEVNFARIFLFIAASALVVSGAISRDKAPSHRKYVILIGLAHSGLVFLTGSRGLAVVQLAAVIYSCGLISSTRIFSIKNIAVGVIGLFTTYVALVTGLALRITAQSGQPFGRTLSEVASQGGAGILNSFNYFELFSATVLFTQENGASFGSNFLNILLRPIPRSIWSEKPLGVGLQLREAFYGDRLSGVPPTFFGEFYLAFGWAGMVLAGALIVFAAGLVQKREHATKNPYAIGFISIFTFSFPIEMMKSGFEVISIFYVYYAIGLTLLWASHRVFFTRKARPLSMSWRPASRNQIPSATSTSHSVHEH